MLLIKYAVYCKYQTLVLQNQIWNSSNFLTFLSRWCALITSCFFFSLIPLCFAIACNDRLFFVPIVLAKSNYRCCEVFYIVVVVISTTILLALYLRLGAFTYPITTKLSFFRYCLQDDIHKNSLYLQSFELQRDTIAHLITTTVEQVTSATLRGRYLRR